jgi:hypothetical protein
VTVSPNTGVRIEGAKVDVANPSSATREGFFELSYRRVGWLLVLKDGGFGLMKASWFLPRFAFGDSLRHRGATGEHHRDEYQAVQLVHAGLLKARC